LIKNIVAGGISTFFGCKTLLHNLETDFQPLLLRRRIQQFADCLDGASSLANQTTHVAFVKGQEEEPLPAFFPMGQDRLPGILDELLHQIAQKLVHNRIRRPEPRRRLCGPS